MLVDDNHDDNFFHKREINKDNHEIIVIVKTITAERLRTK